MPTSTGASSGSFVVPDEGHTESNVFYRIHLTVTDSGGRKHSASRDVLPRTARLDLATVPAGLQLSLDDQPRTTPYSEVAVAGIKRTIGAISPQTLNGRTYEFASWSNGGLAVQTVTAGATDTTYTATFREVATSTPTVVNVAPTADTYVNEGSASTVYGSSASLSARSSTPRAVAYLRFTLPAAPPGKALIKPALRYRTTSLTSAGSASTTQPITLMSTNTWSESTLKWSTRPSSTGTALGSLKAGSVPSTTYTTTLTHTALTSKLETSVSVAVTGGSDNIWFWSRTTRPSAIGPS